MRLSELRGMSLHEVKTIDNYIIMRVASGWLYTDATNGATLFIPDTEEVQEEQLLINRSYDSNETYSESNL